MSAQSSVIVVSPQFTHVVYAKLSGAVVDNKRLGAVLRLAQQKQDELEEEGKRMRSQKMPRRSAQKRVLEELRAINPVLASPQDFIPCLKR
ncbi:hypothetical protein K2911_004547 [Escherichia coli]|nr:hypothetical protein [Escherichia coli]HCO1907440.1 hypothetical protein [Escherichia coli]HEI3504630.1 hypothetical protein [Escherichia coli]